MNKQLLRQQLRHQRRTLPDAQRLLASQALLTQVKDRGLFDSYQRIAFYVAHDGEIDPILLLNYAWEHKKTCYLPVVSKTASTMHFIEVSHPHGLACNHYGIPEPELETDKEISPKELDLVMVPLVGFDKTGHRLGRGKGYYDKCFSFLNNAAIKKPFLLGIAYHFQCIEQLPAMSHDVRLNAVLTDEQWHEF